MKFQRSRLQKVGVGLLGLGKENNSYEKVGNLLFLR